MDNEEMEFECETCGAMFRDRLFGVSRAYERVIFSSPDALEEVHTGYSECIANFCSSACLARGRSAAMRAQCVPIPAVRPGIGPVEACAKCKGPVDMSDWHLTFLEDEIDTSLNRFQPLNVDYIAVVCRQCAPRAIAKASASIDERKLTVS